MVLDGVACRVADMYRPSPPNRGHAARQSEQSTSALDATDVAVASQHCARSQKMPVLFTVCIEPLGLVIQAYIHDRILQSTSQPPVRCLYYMRFEEMDIHLHNRGSRLLSGTNALGLLVAVALKRTLRSVLNVFNQDLLSVMSPIQLPCTSNR